jgi:hypothetical protein
MRCLLFDIFPLILTLAVQWKPLNVIYQLMLSNYSRLTSPNTSFAPIDNLLIVIICLMLSVYLCNKVITLSGFSCTIICQKSLYRLIDDQKTPENVSPSILPLELEVQYAGVQLRGGSEPCPGQEVRLQVTSVEVTVLRSWRHLWLVNNNTDLIIKHRLKLYFCLFTTANTFYFILSSKHRSSVFSITPSNLFQMHGVTC